MGAEWSFTLWCDCNWETKQNIAQSAVVAEYTNCTSAQAEDLPNECPIYDTKQSDGEVPVWNTPLLPLLPGPL